MSHPTILTCPGFDRAFDSAEIDVQRLIRLELLELQRKATTQGPSFLAEYDTYSAFTSAAKAFSGARVLKFKITSGDRLIALLSEKEVTLLDCGPHDAEKQWDRIPNKRRWLKERISHRRPANHIISEGQDNPFLSLEPIDGWSPYFFQESTDEWVHFLDMAQYELVEAIYDSSETHLLGGRGMQSHLIVGGPGTGKTVVLFKLFQKLLGAGVVASLHVSKEVRKYLTSVTHSDIPRASWSDDASVRTEVVLLDDPSTFYEIEHLRSRIGDGRPTVLIAAFDPLQLKKLPDDASFDHFRRSLGAVLHELHSCYRQKEAIGQKVLAMTRVLARSSPYASRSNKEQFAQTHTRLLSEYNRLDFVNPLGYFHVYQRNCLDALSKELRRLAKSPLWQHWPGILFVLDSEGYPEIPPNLKDLIKGVRRQSRVVLSRDVEDIKGVEFQHVFMVLTQATLDALQQPFSKVGLREYDRRRLFRIPVSRAKDSLVLLVAPPESW
jgi:hypothetical protein